MNLQGFKIVYDMKIRVQSTRVFFLILTTTIVSVQSCDLPNELTGVAATVAKLEGEWSCDEQSELYKATSEVYSVYISPDADNEAGVIIDNFYGLQTDARANIAGMSLIIPNQNLEGGFTVSGSGTISDDFKQIDLTYTVDDGSGVVDHCTAVYTK